jgi:transcriptional regulator with XRE-family HTH domain
MKGDKQVRAQSAVFSAGEEVRRALMTEVPPFRRSLAGAPFPRFREQAGYSLDEAARILACDRSKIGRIETGQRGIQPAQLRKLLARYGVDEPRRDALPSVARQTRQAGWWQSGRRLTAPVTGFQTRLRPSPVRPC